MKNFLLLMMAVAAMTFAGCSSDDEGNDTSKLVGSWEATVDYVLIDGEWIEDYSYDSGQYVMTFTETHVTSNDDMLGGLSVKYTYEDNKIWIMGSSAEVLSLTDTELVLKTHLTEEDGEGNETIYDLKTVYVKK